MRLMTRSEIIEALDGVPKMPELEIALCTTPYDVIARTKVWTLEVAVGALEIYYQNLIDTNLYHQEHLKDKSRGSVIYQMRAEVYKNRLDRIRQIMERKGNHAED